MDDDGEMDIVDDDGLAFLETTEDDGSIGNLRGEGVEGFTGHGSLDDYCFEDWD